MRKIKKGDEIIVIAGKDKGRKGNVLKVVRKGEYLIIEGINTVKKHIKANPNANERGGIAIKEMPIHKSNVMVYDTASDEGSRVGIKVLEDGKRVRYFKTTGNVIDV